MAVATLTSKGQVTIPKIIRNTLGLHVGDRIEFVIDDRGQALIKPVTKKVDEVFGMLHKSGKKSVTVDQMNQAIRKNIKVKFK